MHNKKILKLDSVCFSINKKTLIDNITLDIDYGEIACVIGPNGSGKSTLIKLITGELKPTTGNIIFQDKRIEEWLPSDLACCRSVLSQSNHLSFPFSVIDIIKMGRYPINNSTKEKNDEIFKKLINIFDLNKNINQNYITLSGGEKQRVQLARVFAQIWSDNEYSNKMLIIDEPTSFLDINHQYALFDFLKTMNKKGLTILMVLHDLNQAITYSNKIIMLKEAKLIGSDKIGKIINTKKFEEVFNIKLKLIKNDEMESPIITY